MEMKRMIRFAALALCLAATACAGGPGDPDLGASASVSLPEESASIIGEITEVTRGGTPVLLVEQVPTRSAGYPVARVFVNGRTRILARSGGQVSRASAADLVVGTRVQAWFTGGVRESWPVQADAGTILIER
jgi:hypothetical protein